MNNTIYILLFLVIISISIFIFYNYKEKTVENFQVANNFIVSDIFPNLVTPTNYIEIEYYSTFRGIQDEFISFISDYRNYKGEIDRTSDVVATLENDVTVGYQRTYADPYTSKTLKDIGFNLAFTRKFARESEGDSQFVYFYTKGFKTAYSSGPSSKLEPFVTVDNFFDRYEKFKNYITQYSGYTILNFLRNNQLYSISKLKDKINSTNYLASNWYDLTMINDLLKFNGDSSRTDFKNESIEIKYPVGNLSGIFPNRNTEIDNAVSDKLRIYLYGSINEAQTKDFKDSAFFGSLFNFKSTDYINIYLRIPYYSSNLNGLDLQYSHGLFSNDVMPRNIRQTYLFDPSLDRNEVILVTDNDKLNEGIRIAEGFAWTGVGAAVLLSLRDMRDGYLPVTREYQKEVSVFIRGNIPYNDEVFNFLDRINNTLTFPANNNPIYINGNPNGGIFNLSNITLKQQFIGTLTPKLVSIMPVSLRKYITSWSYNRTIRILQRRLEEVGSDNTQKFYFLMGLTLNNYFYSKNINDSVGMDNWKSLLSQYGLNNPDTVFGDEEIGGRAGYNINNGDISYKTGGSYGLIYGYFNPSARSLTYNISQDKWWAHHTVSTRDYDTVGGIFRAINSHGTLPSITNSVIDDLYMYYTSYIQKLVPDYGIPLNVLDQRIMDSIAQHLYETSEGLYEITYIYDVYRVGSNMIDIRFDKKQRLDNIKYLNLRNQYIPQLNEYNRLLSIFEDGTWVNSFSNIDDYNNTLSLSITNLDPLFNPVYPVGGQYNYTYLNNLQSANNNTMDILSSRINIARGNIQSQIGLNSNFSNALNIITPQAGANGDLPTSPKTVYEDITEIQNQYYSTVNAATDLSNMINGIETSVARVFITLDNSNFNINAIALGINAALSYNNLYNGNIDTALTGEGNANYQPTIRYTKNIKPPIQCGNIDFMKTVANLYRDTIFTDISNIVLSNIPYNSNDGEVVVDKILGFSQINDTTCGYTWIETQYDFLTNKPVKRNTVNIQIPFMYDDSEYQNSRITFCNDPTLMKYGSNAYPFGNLTGWIDKWVSDSRILLQNDICNYSLNIPQIDARLSNLVARSNEIYKFYDTPGWRTYSNTESLYFEGGKLCASCLDQPSEWYNIRGVNINQYIINNFSNKTYFQLYNDKNYYYSRYYSVLYDDIGTQSIWDSNNYTYNYIFNTNAIINKFTDKFNKHYNFTGGYVGGVNNVNPYIVGIILGIIDNNEIDNFVEGTKRESINSSQEKIETIAIINDLTNKLNNLDSTANQMKISINIDPTIQNYILNNLIIIPRYLSDADNKLDDADGACPVLRCDNPSVMTQLMEQYNTDSNNQDKILNILNAYTVNSYQCDYRVTTTDPRISRLPIANSNLQNILNELNTSTPELTTAYQTLQTATTNLYTFVTSTFNKIDMNKLFLDKANIEPFPAGTTLYNLFTNAKNPWSDNILGTTSNLIDIYKRLALANPQDFAYADFDQTKTVQINLPPSPLFSIYDQALLDYNNKEKRNADLQLSKNTLTAEIAETSSNINNKTLVKTKSFELGADVRDCTYYYASVSNTGYFVSENQNPPSVIDNKSGKTGFYYINTVFNDFNSAVNTLINPLIEEGGKQSSAIYNSVLNQRTDTYDSIGQLNILTFSNAPSLNTSNVIYMLQNNKRFFNSFFNNYTGNVRPNMIIVYPSPVRVQSTSQPFIYNNDYITNIKGVGITNSNTLQILVDLNNTSACLEYEIRVTPNFTDYTAYYIKNISIRITSDDIFNMIKPLQYVFSNNILLSNNIPQDLFVKKAYSLENLNTHNCLLPVLIDSSNVSKVLLSAGYNLNDITNYYIDSNNYTYEFLLKTNENLPVNKMFLNIQIGFNRGRNVNCDNYVFLIKDFDILNSTIPIFNPYDQKTVDMIHNYFNNKYKISSNISYNSIIGQVYSIKPITNTILQCSASVYYTTSSNIYINTMLPNDIYYDNLKYFEVQFMPTNLNTIYINYMNEILPFNDGQNINDFSKITNIPNPDYYAQVTPFIDYKKPITNYDFIKFESISPLSFNTINLYSKKKQQIQYKIKDRSANLIILEIEEPISGYSFVTNNSGTSPNSWVVKASDGKIWEVIHEQSYNLESKKLYQTPIFFLDGSVSNTNATQPQPQSFEKPEIDIEKFKKYYKQKINESSNPEFKKYMYSNNTYYFMFDDYDLNRNLVSKDLIIGFETSGSRIKKAILYEDNDGNYKPFNLHDSKQKEFWDSMIGLALEFQDI